MNKDNLTVNDVISSYNDISKNDVDFITSGLWTISKDALLEAVKYIPSLSNKKFVFFRDNLHLITLEVCKQKDKTILDELYSEQV